MNDILNHLHQSKKASAALAKLSSAQKNRLLLDFEKILKNQKKKILSVNQKDLKAFTGDESVRERLELNEKKFAGLLRTIQSVRNLPDPIGRTIEERRPKNGLIIKKISVPLGVVGVIYESRPNVTVDLAALCLKSGNAVILKGGKEAYFSNKVIVNCVHLALKKNHLPISSVHLIAPQDDWKDAVMNAHGLIDVLIPRGSQRLIEWVRKESRIPIIETGAGVCHVFADKNYDIKNAVDIIFNAKTQRPSVCNALDTLVVNKAIAKKLLPAAAQLLLTKNVELRCDSHAHNILRGHYPEQLLKKAQTSDFGFEFLSQKMAIKIVKNFEEGLAFVKKYTSGHSEAILTFNKNHAARFLKEIDAAAVYHNASTRFTDGGEFGLGAEIGVSTQKLHARGPMGLMALTSYKWVVEGKGQVRD